MGRIQIELLGISVRSINALKRNNIFYLDELLKMELSDILKFRNVGEKSLKEIQNIFEKSSRDDSFNRNMELIDNGSIYSYMEYTIENYIYPETVGSNNWKVLFRSENGLWQDSAVISEKALSVRSYNCLCRFQVMTLEKLMKSNVRDFLNIRSLGQKSIDEIIGYIKNNTKIEIIDSELENNLKEAKDLFYKKIAEDKQFSISENIVNDIMYNLSIGFKTNFESSIVIDNDYIESASFYRNYINKENVINDLKQSIAQKFLSLNKVFTFKDIKQQMPKFLKSRTITRAIDCLIAENKIEKIDNKYRAVLPSLKSWLETLKPNCRRAVELRFKGKTLQECGELLGVSRERVRQIVSKTIKDKPLLREDDYSFWFGKYDISMEAMIFIFEIPCETYNYLKNAYKKGELPIEELMSDEYLTKSAYKNAKKFFLKDSLIIGGKTIPCHRQLIIKEFLKLKCSREPIVADNLYDDYMNFLRECGKESEEKLNYPSMRSFISNLLSQNFVLSSFGQKVRYFQIDDLDIIDFVNEMDLSQYEDVEITTLKLYRDNEDLMHDSDIYDEYELHNLLKKTENIWNANIEYDISIKRMPFLSFGNADRERQAIDLLFKIAPVTYDDYGKNYEEEYGVLKATVLSNIHKYISKYYSNGVYSVDQPLLDDKQYHELKEYLKEDFYNIADIKEYYVSKWGINTVDRINARTIQELGFKPYTRYMISNVYPSADAYFRHRLTKDDVINLNSDELKHINLAYNVLDELRKNYEILEFEKNKYINIRQFTKISGFNKTDLKKYVEETINFAGSRRVFTIKSLKKEGYESQFEDLGFTNWFESGLLKNSGEITYTISSKGYVFSTNKESITLVDVIEDIVENRNSINILDLEFEIEDTYGIQIKRDKIISLVKNKSIYYDSIMEKVYLNKDEYYKELDV